MLEVLGIKNADKLIPGQEEQAPRDPVTENMAVLRMQPIKAFAYQDHQAHMTTHQAFMQDPNISATLGQNPAAQQMMAALMAHIAEHAAFAYRAQVEMQLGVPLPSLDEESNAPIAPQDEKALAPLIAAAAQRTLVQNQAMAAQQAAQQAAQNPELQMKQAELQLKAQELQRKEADSVRDFQIAQQKVQLEAQRLALEAQKAQGEPPEMKAMRAQQELAEKAARANQDLSHKEQMHRMKLRQQAEQRAIRAQQSPKGRA